MTKHGWQKLQLVFQRLGMMNEIFFPKHFDLFLEKTNPIVLSLGICSLSIMIFFRVLRRIYAPATKLGRLLHYVPDVGDSKI